MLAIHAVFGKSLKKGDPPTMADEMIDLVKALRDQSSPVLYELASAMRDFVRFGKNLTPNQKQEAARISAQIKEIGEKYLRAMQEIEPLGQDAASDKEHNEYLLRKAAILEFHEDALMRAAKDYRQLVIAVVSRP